MNFTIDVDGTIAFPRPDIFDVDFQRCRQNCIDAGLVRAEEIAGLRRHTELLILPGVCATHVPAPGAVETLQALHQAGDVIHYCTARTSLNPEERSAIHEATRAWLKHHAFPGNVSFAKLISDKLLQALNIAAPHTLLIDDRAAGIIDAYYHIVQSDPTRAKQIRQRVIIVSYGRREVQAPKDAPKVVHLKDWSEFSSMLSGVESMVTSAISTKG
ncbi:hypothetical protein KSF_095680 [Reticulibacter mediterranei]|uniref:Uncharacterized protein n=1 Tax=Reticulibacter mediterranei TaxID=2778369 RepID=A0A8J3N8H0_9CHLR|nr:hypothetical protein [Reticulibacter mediterranei]GHO99520.1 hypothetical protein KSF_095680 [Reticulibacter mediterranei]